MGKMIQFDQQMFFHLGWNQPSTAVALTLAINFGGAKFRWWCTDVNQVDKNVASWLLLQQRYLLASSIVQLFAMKMSTFGVQTIKAWDGWRKTYNICLYLFIHICIYIYICIHVYPPLMLVLEKNWFQSCIYFQLNMPNNCLIAVLRYNYWTRLPLCILFIDFERSTGLGRRQASVHVPQVLDVGEKLDDFRSVGFYLQVSFWPPIGPIAPELGRWWSMSKRIFRKTNLHYRSTGPVYWECHVKTTKMLVWSTWILLNWSIRIGVGTFQAVEGSLYQGKSVHVLWDVGIPWLWL